MYRSRIPAHSSPDLPPSQKCPTCHCNSSSPVPIPVPVITNKASSIGIGKKTGKHNNPVQTFYPTPPPSPELDDQPSALPSVPGPVATTCTLGAESTSTSTSTSTPPTVDPVPDQGQTFVPIETSRPSFVPLIPLPIELRLDTPHALPYTSTLRLSTPAGILGALGGNRVLRLDNQSLWDRMPFVTGGIAGMNGMNGMTGTEREEESVERMLGGHGVAKKGFKQDRINSIYVQPPTPERETPPAAAHRDLPTVSNELPNGSSSSSSSYTHTPPSTSPMQSPDLATGSSSSVKQYFPSHSADSASLAPVPASTDSASGSASASASASPNSISLPTLMPLQVLPEVRSPPRRNLAMTADSLQLNLRRGRRPRLFGFTEIPDSGSSSAASSANNSRASSPDRSGAAGGGERITYSANSPLGLSSLHGEVNTNVAKSSSESKVNGVAGTGNGTSHSQMLSPTPPAPGATLPRRGPIRTRSDTHLPTITSSMSSISRPVVSTAVSSSSITPTPTTAASASSSRQSPSVSPRLASSSSSSAHVPNYRRRTENGLKLDFSGIIPLNAPIDSSSTYAPSPYSAKLIRKKSGELVKPALKYGGPLTASGTPMEENPSPRFGESKSLPATPSCPKYVHFDSQLERVKLFNKDHKPQVVSRGGSPTQYNTSEGEEYPFPSTDEEGGSAGKVRLAIEEKKVLSIRLPNFPTSHPPDSDLHLESLYLDDDRKSLRGVVVVRNFAYSKWVAIRFTLDWWQTTSEVSAAHKESIKGGDFDRFSFHIKLADVMAKIEEKTLFLCVRYNSEGREIWDSNNGENYQVIFEKIPDKTAAGAVKAGAGAGRGKVVGGRNSQWGLKGKEEDRMADLREKLSRLTAEDDERPQLSPNRTTFLSPGNASGSASSGGVGGGRRGVNFGFGNSGSPAGSPRKGFASLDSNTSEPPASLPNQGLAARYDFGKALNRARTSPDTRVHNVVDLPSVRTGLLSFEGNGDKEKSLKSTTSTGTPQRERPGMDFYSPRYTPAGLPGSSTFSADFFAPPPAAKPFVGPTAVNGNGNSSGITESPVPMSTSSMSSTKIQSPLPVPATTVPSTAAPVQIPGHGAASSGSGTPLEIPDLTIQGPSPPPPESPIAVVTSLGAGTPRSPVRPSLARSRTSPAALPNALPASPQLGTVSTADHLEPTISHLHDQSTSLSAVERSPSPPFLAASGSSSTSSLPSDGNDSPASPSSPNLPDMSLSRFTESRLRGSDDSMASYSSFIEQFCWGGASSPSSALLPPTSEPRRAHSSSTLDEYFAHGSSAGSGFTTPRPSPLAQTATTTGQVNGYGRTPSTAASAAAASSHGSFHSAYTHFSPSASPSIGLEFPGAGSPSASSYIYHHSHNHSHSHQHHHHYHNHGHGAFGPGSPAGGVYGKRSRDDVDTRNIESAAVALSLSMAGAGSVMAPFGRMGASGTASPPVRASG